jgi:CheY-like chemotaxis protein/HPt (histidine-containing phosphotransfer) domain-containing protein
LEVRSQLDIGTLVIVRLPLEPIAAHAATLTHELTPSSPHAIPTHVPAVEDAARDRQLILVVDDHPINRRVLVQQLEWLGYACEAFASGQAALERYRERLAGGSPHAVTITDCQMPEMDGYELARQIRCSEANTSYKTVLIAFTAATLRGALEARESGGFNDLLTKPIDLATLKAKLNRWLPLSRDHSNTLPTATDQPIAAASLVKLTPQLQAEFRSAHADDLAILDHGIEERDVLAINRGAHRIRGAARMVGARGIDQAATHLQRAARTENWRQIRAALTLLHTETRSLFAQFNPPGSNSA